MINIMFLMHDAHVGIMTQKISLKVNRYNYWIVYWNKKVRHKVKVDAKYIYIFPCGIILDRLDGRKPKIFQCISTWSVLLIMKAFSTVSCQSCEKRPMTFNRGTNHPLHQNIHSIPGQKIHCRPGGTGPVGPAMEGPTFELGRIFYFNLKNILN